MSFTALSHGVFYVLDEVHIAFPARDWVNTGQQVLYYLSQHRKLGDDVLCVTQHLDNLDKQFRTMAQDFTWIRNLSKIKMGLFKMPGLFLRSTYCSDKETAEAVETGTFRLNVSGIAKCYDTAAGIGVVGRSGADLGERRKGMPWWVGLGGIGLGIAFLLFGVPKIALAVLRKSGVNPDGVPVTVTVPALVVTNETPRPRTLLRRADDIVTSTNIFWTAFVQGEYWFSDGRRLTNGVQVLGETVVVLEDGELIRYRRPAR